MSNSKDNLIARKYADALAEIRHGKTVVEDLLVVQETFNASQELREFLANPSYELKDKQSVLVAIFKDKVQKEVINTLQLLLEKRRMNLAPLLVDHYQQIYYQKENIELAKLSSVRKLDDPELAEIKSQLEASFDKTIELSNEIDESLLAGVKIQVANKVIDSSLKSKLKRMKDLLGV